VLLEHMIRNAAATLASVRPVCGFLEQNIAMMIVQRALLFLLLSSAALTAFAQTGTTFTYQGRLYNNGQLANGSYVLRVRPYSAVTDGTALASSLDTPALNVVDGIFSTTLDFGNAVFTGSPVFLDIQVQAPASSFVQLSPRQPVTPTPYAINADKLDGLDAAELIDGTLIPFSSGAMLNGATVVSSSPRLIGFGSSTTQTIDGAGQSFLPTEMGGFSFAVPFAGTIENLQVSADLFVASVTSINTLGLQYDFTVFRSPSVPNNGTDHFASPYLTTPLTASLRFGFPNSIVIPGTFRSATTNVAGPLVVNAGDRIGIRVRTLQSSDPSASDVTQLSFNATLTYVRTP